MPSAPASIWQGRRAAASDQGSAADRSERVRWRNGQPYPDKILPDMRIHLAPDCAITLEKRIQVEAMTLSPPVSLSDAKLDVLRRLDQFRQWRSLDEKRYCLVCGKIITGRQIEVAGGTRGNGALRLSCPTERCNSIPMDWVLPTDEIIARFEMMAAEERKAVESKRVARANEMAQLPKAEDNGIASRFLKFAFHFKRAS